MRLNQSFLISTVVVGSLLLTSWVAAQAPKQEQKTTQAAPPAKSDAQPPKKKEPSPEDWKTVMRELKKISKRHEQERKDENDLKDLEIQR